MSFLPKRKRKDFTELSKQQQDKIKLAERIEKLGEITEWSCLHCLENQLDCFVMAARPDLKCSNCTRRGKQCVSVSWEVLDRTSEKKTAEIEDAEKRLKSVNSEVRKMMAEVVRRQEEAARLIESIERNRLVLKQAHKRAEAKTICLLEELKEEEEEAERSAKRKRSSSDCDPEASRPLGVVFDDLLAWPEGEPLPDWSLLGDSDGTGQQGVEIVGSSL